MVGNERCRVSCIFHTFRALDSRARVSLHGVIEQNERGARAETAGKENSENEKRNEKQGDTKRGISQQKEREAD